jgi:hypothetical protein
VKQLRDTVKNYMNICGGKMDGMEDNNDNTAIAGSTDDGGMDENEHVACDA